MRNTSMAILAVALVIMIFVSASYALTAMAYFSDFENIPEPTSLLLLGSGLIGIAGLSRKLKTKKNK